MQLKQRYMARTGRYDNAATFYRRCGNSGILLPKSTAQLKTDLKCAR